MPTMEWMVKGLGKPKGWPVAWDFPRSSAWPPAWPIVLGDIERVKLDAIFNLGVLRFLVMDQYGEQSDRLDGQYLQIMAGSDGGSIRLRSPGQSDWCEGMLVEISDGEADAEIEVEQGRGEGRRFLEISIYGVDNTPVISLGA
jgi:hypothetical protein